MARGDGRQMKVFISHQWTDKQLAERVANDLEPFADVWMDYRNLRPGDSIQGVIDEALEQVDLVLVIWTEHASRSSGVAAEIETCRRLGATLVPCIFHYDSDGRPHPPLPSSLESILGVDFHHYRTGIAQLAEHLVHVQRSRLPAEASMEDHPAVRLLGQLRGYLNYMANYRNLKGVPDERGEWADRIIREIETYVARGGDKEAVVRLLDAARDHADKDPEAVGQLVARIEALLGRSSHENAPASPFPRPQSAAERARTRPTPPPPDELDRRLIEITPPGSEQLVRRQVEAYIDAAPHALQALAAFAHSTRSEAGAHVVHYLQRYLATADDVIPDHHGRYGMLDDAWLILNTTFRLVESGLLPATSVPVNWQAVVSADYFVRSLLPAEALETLSSIVFELLQIIAMEVVSYQPWFTPQGHGYAPTMAAPASAGGAWEDQMSERLLGTGLSLYG